MLLSSLRDIILFVFGDFDLLLPEMRQEDEQIIDHFTKDLGEYGDPEPGGNKLKQSSKIN